MVLSISVPIPLSASYPSNSGHNLPISTLALKMTAEMGSNPGSMTFCAPPVQVSFDGFLFDMDGTIIDSTAAVVKHWETYVQFRDACLCLP